MSAVATREREAVAARAAAAGRRPRLFDDGVTLEDRILGAWEGLVVEGRAACPVCGDSMAPAPGCSNCGSELS